MRRIEGPIDKAVSWREGKLRSTRLTPPNVYLFAIMSLGAVWGNYLLNAEQGYFSAARARRTLRLILAFSVPAHPPFGALPQCNQRAKEGVSCAR